jgi:low temperature requirement protein LtrA
MVMLDCLFLLYYSFFEMSIGNIRAYQGKAQGELQMNKRRTRISLSTVCICTTLYGYTLVDYPYQVLVWIAVMLSY